MPWAVLAGTAMARELFGELGVDGTAVRISEVQALPSQKRSIPGAEGSGYQPGIGEFVMTRISALLWTRNGSRVFRKSLRCGLCLLLTIRTR
jgi:hypothetical protein